MTQLRGNSTGWHGQAQLARGGNAHTPGWHGQAQLARGLFLCQRLPRASCACPCHSILLTIFALALSLFAAPASAQTGDPEITGLRIGFAGQYKLGVWTPVEVTLKGGDTPLTGRVEVIVSDGDGERSRVTTPPNRPVRLAPSQSTSVSLFVRFGQEDGQIDVVLRDADDNRIKTERTFEGDSTAAEGESIGPLPTEQTLIIAVGPPLGLEDALKNVPRVRAEKVTIAQLSLEDAVNQLPTRWIGYEGVSTLVLSTTKPEMYRLLENNERLTALEEWLRMGGRIVLLVGADAPAVIGAGPEGHPLARFAPGTFDKMVPLRQTGSLEQFAETTFPVFPPGKEGELLVPQLTDVRGIVEVREANLPLIVRTPHAFGEVLFAAFDMGRPPLADWQGRGDMLRRMLRLPAKATEDAGAGRDVPFAASQTGLTDIAGQLRGALDQFAGVRVVPFVAVASLIVVYILLIGPGDYFFVKRFLKRMELTWITFPLIVVLFSVGAYFLARWAKGTRLQLNQADLVDVDVQSGLVRGATWLNLFSPQTDVYQLALRPQLPGGETPERATVHFSWLGLPGSALGGMGSRTTNPPVFNRPYDFAPELDAVLNVPIKVWSTKSLTARWSSETSLDLDADLIQGTEDELLGSITNTLDIPLQDCLLAFGRHGYTLGTLAPGQTFDLEPGTTRSELETFLTGRRLEQDAKRKGYTQTFTPYDLLSYDVPAILRQMMFFEAAGGRRYAGVDNEYQRFVDLSDLLADGRAILVCYSRKPGQETTDKSAGALLLRDGVPLENQAPDPARPDQHWTCYRFVFPVASPRAN
jgi:hypothetical protein